MCSPFYVVAIGEIRSKVSAAAFLAAKRRPRDHQPHDHEASHPLKFPIGRFRLDRVLNQRMPGREPGNHLVQTSSIAKQAAVPPHQPSNIVCTRRFD